MTNDETTDEIYAGDVNWQATAVTLQAEVTRLTVELAAAEKLAEDPNENREGLVSTLSELMPPEDEWYSNPDGSEESEVIAFVKEATELYRVIYSARKRDDFDSDDVLLFAIAPSSGGKVLVELDLGPHDAVLEHATPTATSMDVGEWLKNLAKRTREAIRDAYKTPPASCGAVSGAGETCSSHPAHDEDWIDVDVEGRDVVRAAGTRHSWEG